MRKGLIKRHLNSTEVVEVTTPIGSKLVAVMLDGHLAPILLFEGDPTQEGVESHRFAATFGESTVDLETEGEWVWAGTLPLLGTPQLLTVWREDIPEL